MHPDISRITALNASSILHEIVTIITDPPFKGQ